MKSVWLALALTLGAALAAQAQYTYDTNSDGTLDINGYTHLSGAVVIPSSIDVGHGVFLPVTTITNGAITGDAGITSVTISQGIASIGEEAFEACVRMTNISIPNSVTNIGLTPCFMCASLQTFNVAGGNQYYRSIGGVLFNKAATVLLEYPDNAATNYNMPNGVLDITNYAFEECQLLTRIAIAGTVTNIGDFAFFDCESITNLTVPASVTTLGQSVFSALENLTNIAVDPNNPDFTDIAGCLYNKAGTVLLDFPSGSYATAFTVPPGTVELGPGSFLAAEGLTNVTIGNSVTAIDHDAFDYSYQLQSVTMGHNVASFGQFVFYDCDDLAGVYFYGSAPVADDTEFYNDDLNTPTDPTTAYYLPGTAGWPAFQTATDIPVAWWNLPAPILLGWGPDFGPLSGGFSFDVSWAANGAVVVEAATNMYNPDWTPLETNDTYDGYWTFTDPNAADFPNRFYRAVSP